MKRILLLSFLVMVTTIHAQTQDSVEHARQVLNLLRQEKFADLAKEFNAQMTALLPTPVLAQTWAAMRDQLGEFKSELGQQSASAGGMTVATLGVQFERAALNMLVSFDAEQKIAGLQFLPRPADAPAATLPAGLTEEALTVGSGQFALPGTLTLPRGTGRVAAVVLVHGSGPEDRDETLGPNKPFRDLAWGLASRGIAVLRYEKRTKQYGALMAQNMNLTVREETVDDAVVAAQGLRRHARVDASKVFIAGHSLGGMLAPRIGQQDSSIAGLVLLAGNVRPLPELIVEQTEYLASLTPDTAAKQAGIAALKSQAAKLMDPVLPLNTPVNELMGAPAAYWKDLNAYKPGTLAASLMMPMLILQGERDYQVTMKDFEAWKDALKARTNVTFKSYSDLNHIFVTGTGKSTPAEYEKPGKVSETVISDIAAWVKAR
jgi:uncharacterized protein